MRADKKSAIIIFLALFTAFIFASSYIFMIVLRNDNSFTLTVVKGVDGQFLDQTPYAANIRDVYDGHVIVTDALIYEQKNSQGMITPWIPYFILGLMTHVTGSVSNTILINSFILPFILFLLTYFLSYRMTKDKCTSVASTVFMLLGYIFILSPPVNKANIISFITRHFDASGPLNYFNRLPFIQLTFVFFMASIALLYISLESKNRIYLIFCGIVSGLLFYTYLYHWMSFFIGLGVMSIVFFLKKDKESFKKTTIIFLIAGIVSIPFWLNYASFASDKAIYEDVSSKVGIEKGRDIDILKTIKYTSLLAIFVAVNKKRNNGFYLLTSLFIAGLIGFNLQLVTGFNVQYGHYEAVTMIPLAAIMIIYAIWEVSQNSYRNPIFNKLSIFLGKFYKHVFITITVFFLFTGISAQYTYATNTYKYYEVDKNYIDAYNWLNKNTQVDDVVLSLSIEQNYLLPVYTHNNVFLPNGLISSLSTNETLRRFYITSRLFNISPSYIEGLIDGVNLNEYRKSEITKSFDESKFEKSLWNPYLFQLKFFSKDKNAYVLPKESIMKDYTDYTDVTGELLSEYRVDYILTSPYERGAGNETFLSHVKKAWSNGIIDIYSVNEL